MLSGRRVKDYISIENNHGEEVDLLDIADTVKLVVELAELVSFEKFKKYLLPMKLFKQVDGANEHYCIGRPMNDDTYYWEFYNKGKWCSTGEIFVGKQLASEKLKELMKVETDSKIRQVLDQHFLQTCEEEVKQYEDNPEYPRLFTDVLNHSDVRAFCLEVSRKLLTLAFT